MGARTHSELDAVRADDRGYRPDPRRWRALAVCLMAVFLTLLDDSAVNVAVPSIRTSLAASDSAMAWVLTGYPLAFGLVLVPSGRLGDARGRRPVFLTGLALFVVTSLACGLAQTPAQLVVGRIAQGIGGGFLIPQVSAFIQALFRGAERGRAFGLLGMVVALSTVIGQLLGGAILHVVAGHDAWRWVFLVNVPVGVTALLLALRLLPAPVSPGRREPLDLVGGVLLTAGLLLMLLPLLQSRSSAPPALWLAMPAGLLVLAAFGRWERRYEACGHSPLVALALLRRPLYAFGLGIGLLYFAGFTSVFFMLTLFLQSGLGFSPLQAGLAATPSALGSALAAPLAGRFVARAGRRLVAAGLALTVVGLLATEAVVRLLPGVAPPAQVGRWLALPLFVAGLGCGCVISPNVALTLSEVPVERTGSAAGVLQTGQRIGGAAGIASLAAVFFTVLGRGGAAGGATSAEPGRAAWTDALAAGLLVSSVLVACALVVALVDLRRSPKP